MISLLIVDDQAVIRRGLKALFKLEKSIEVIGEADNGKTALELVKSLQPNIVLMDVRMPIMDGVAATKEIAQRFPASKILVLTTFDYDDYVVKAIKYGASGYLLKQSPYEQLVQAIVAVHQGYTQLGPGIVEKLMNNYPLPKPRLPHGWSELTSRELEILRLVAMGANNAEIAQKLHITYKTVKNHLTHIFNRLDVRDRTSAAILANSVWGVENRN